MISLVLSLSVSHLAGFPDGSTTSCEGSVCTCDSANPGGKFVPETDPEDSDACGSLRDRCLGDFSCGSDTYKCSNTRL